MKIVSNKIFLLLFFLISAYSFVSAQDTYVVMKDVEAFKLKLKNSSKTTKTIECNFIQEKKMSMLAKNAIAKGHFCFKKPGFIRWEYIQPYSYLIIMAKKKMFVKDDGSRKQYDTQSNNIFKDLGALMINFVQGNIAAFEKDFTLDYLENKVNFYIKMIPKTLKQKEYFSQVDIYFDKNDMSVYRIQMTETDGDYTSFEFVDKKINQPISDEKFSFK